jgi:hypothetical protein
MTNFTFTLSTGKLTVAATKYKIAPRSAPFAATLDGQPAEAWTTEGRGSAYIYFRQNDVLHYAKVLATDTVAARTSLVIESEGFAPDSAPVTAAKKSRRSAKVSV